MVKKDFIVSKVCLCFSCAMTMISLLLNGLLYRESKRTALRSLREQRLLPDSGAIRTIREAEEDSAEETDSAPEQTAMVRQSDIEGRLRSYNNILTISRLKSVINTLLLAGLGLAAVFGGLTCLKRALRKDGE